MWKGTVHNNNNSSSSSSRSRNQRCIPHCGRWWISFPKLLADLKKREITTARMKRWIVRVVCVFLVVTFVLLSITHPGDEYLVLLSNHGIMITGCGISYYTGLSSCRAERNSREIHGATCPTVTEPIQDREETDDDFVGWTRGHCLLKIEDTRYVFVEPPHHDNIVVTVDDRDRRSVGSKNAKYPLSCTHYLASGNLKEGKVTFVTASTNIAFVAKHHRVYQNHAAYAEYFGYNFVVTIVDDERLKGRSMKFAKHFALRSLVSRNEWDVTCSVDADAWFAAWEPLEWFVEFWPTEKEIMIPYSGQMWLNSGFFCMRNTAFAQSFAQSVLDVLHDPGRAKGFCRDQPAMWHVLATTWQNEGLLDYEGSDCSYWYDFCNPVGGPLDCWHQCFWKPLSASHGHAGWALPESANRFSHLHMPSRRNDLGLPEMHRMCVVSCGSTLDQLVTMTCETIFRGSSQRRCYPIGREDKLQCGTEGCAAELTVDGGAYVKHTGNRFWTSDLDPCIPLSARDASETLRSTRPCLSPPP